METADAWLSEWRSLGQAEWQRWLGALPGAGAAHPAGLHDAAAAFASFAEEFGRLAQSAAGADPAKTQRLSGELEALARDFFARAVPPWPAGTGLGGEWAAALQSWSMVLAEVAHATARAFAARLAAPAAPTTLRATFDAWIDCAEAAFQSAAHSEAFASAQARLFNELVRSKARQQALLEQVARNAGMPTRSEVDALHDELRTLRAELAATRAAPPDAPAPRRKRAPPRTRR